MSSCSALLRFSSCFDSTFCARSIDDPTTMLNAAQRATIPLIFFMPHSRKFDGDETNSREMLSRKTWNQNPLIIGSACRVSQTTAVLLSLPLYRIRGRARWRAADLGPMTHGTGRYPGHPSRGRSRRTALSPDEGTREACRVLRRSLSNHRLHS